MNWTPVNEYHRDPNKLCARVRILRQAYNDEDVFSLPLASHFLINLAVGDVITTHGEHQEQKRKKT